MLSDDKTYFFCFVSTTLQEYLQSESHNLSFENQGSNIMFE